MNEESLMDSSCCSEFIPNYKYKSKVNKRRKIKITSNKIKSKNAKYKFKIQNQRKIEKTNKVLISKAIPIKEQFESLFKWNKSIPVNNNAEKHSIKLSISFNDFNNKYNKDIFNPFKENKLFYNHLNSKYNIEAIIIDYPWLDLDIEEYV